MFCGKIPRDLYEDELIPLFEKCGQIWDLRLMMDPMTCLNRGYAFVTFTTRAAAQEAVKQVGDTRQNKVPRALMVFCAGILKSLIFRLELANLTSVFAQF